MTVISGEMNNFRLFNIYSNTRYKLGKYGCPLMKLTAYLKIKLIASACQSGIKIITSQRIILFKIKFILLA